MPEWEPFRDAMDNRPVDATYIIQRNLASRLKDRGHRLTYAAHTGIEEFIVTPDHKQALYGPRTWAGGSLFNLVGKVTWRIQRALGIPYLSYFLNYRYMNIGLQFLPGHDIVYERNGLFYCGLAMASRKLDLPYVMFFEADQIMELDIMGKPLTGLLRRRARQIMRYNLNAADCIVCVSEVGREYLMSAWNVPAHKLIVFPNAVDVDKFKPDAATRTAVRASLQLEDNPIIMFLGNFFAWHDVPTLLHAFADVLKSYPAARLVLVGDGEHRTVMEKRAAELGISQATMFTGIVPPAKAPSYVAAADIAVVPYPQMQQKMWLSPLKLFEYMASGKALVASAVGQINQVVRDRENGLLVPPGDSSALASALIALLSNSALRDALGKQARRDAESKYSWDNYIARLERLMRSVIARQPLDMV